MYINKETLLAIKEKCRAALLSWEIIDRETDPLRVTALNSETKVSVTSELMEEDGHVYAVIYKVVDQTSIIRPKRATIVFYTDGDLHCEYSAFKSEEDILLSLNK